MPELEGIDHVALAVRDVPGSVRWYQEVLGLERLHEEAWGDYPAVVGIGGTAISTSRRYQHPIAEHISASHIGQYFVAVPTVIAEHRRSRVAYGTTVEPESQHSFNAVGADASL